MKNKFAERLEQTLREKGLSQSEFARIIKFNHQVINQYCRGKREPSIDNLILICKELGESLDYMTGVKDE